jgi:hypothetical protein
VHLEDVLRGLGHYNPHYHHFDIERIEWILEQASRPHLKSKQDQGVEGCTKDEENESVTVSTLRKLGLRPNLSIASMRPTDSMRTYRVGAWVHDEAFQTTTSLFHAASLRTTYARQHEYGLDVSRYAGPNNMMGQIEFVTMCEDHLQLAPVPRLSMLAPVVGSRVQSGTLSDVLSEYRQRRFFELIRRCLNEVPYKTMIRSIPSCGTKEFQRLLIQLHSEAKERNELLTFKIIRLGICIAEAWASTRGGSR